MFSIMILLREKPDWPTVQKVVIDPNFLKRLKDLEKDKITEERIFKLEKFTQQPEIQGNLSKYSQQVNILKEYVFAVEAFAKINLEIEPIWKRVKKLNMELASKEQELDLLKKNYQKNLQNLELLNQKFVKMESSYQNCEGEFVEIEKKLDRCESLNGVLQNLQKIWQAKLQVVNLSEKTLISEIYFESLYVDYVCSFSQETRE